VAQKTFSGVINSGAVSEVKLHRNVLPYTLAGFWGTRGREGDRKREGTRGGMEGIVFTCL